MTDCSELRGMCACCTLAEQCTYPRANGFRVRHCDEFCPPPPRRFEAPLRPERMLPEQTIAASREHKGLCSNCGNRDGCVFMNRTAQLLQCEEYC